MSKIRPIGYSILLFVLFVIAISMMSTTALDADWRMPTVMIVYGVITGVYVLLVAVVVTIMSPGGGRE